MLTRFDVNAALIPLHNHSCKAVGEGNSVHLELGPGIGKRVYSPALNLHFLQTILPYGPVMANLCRGHWLVTTSATCATFARRIIIKAVIVFCRDRRLAM